MPPDEFVVQFSFRLPELVKSMTFAMICRRSYLARHSRLS